MYCMHNFYLVILCGCLSQLKTITNHVDTKRYKNWSYWILDYFSKKSTSYLIVLVAAESVFNNHSEWSRQGMHTILTHFSHHLEASLVEEIVKDKDKLLNTSTTSSMSHELKIKQIQYPLYLSRFM